MNNIFVFCVETTRQAQTDNVYINQTLKRFFNAGTKNTIRYVYLDSKGHYNNKKTLREIDKLIRNSNWHKVIYFLDTDRYDINYDDVKVWENITKFCEQNDYELVSFSRNVEDVYLGEIIQDSEKIKMAAKFQRDNAINNISKNILLQDL